MSSIPMQRDERDVWSDDVPIGTFEAHHCTMEGRPSVSGVVLFVCPRGKRCVVLLGPTFEARRHEDEPNVWAWNDDETRPTVSPSVNCIAEKDGKPTGGCGWHGFIRNGVLEGA